MKKKKNNFNKDIYKTRIPIVTIMGHVDHGKTSLLDLIRSIKTVHKEYGGITQYIQAYSIKIKNKKITFLDTPGHKLFLSMRERGAEITDIIVLVIAADDGVMPQTIEAIKHAKKFNVPIIVAINKIDKIFINLEKIKNDLSKYNILSEEWGGENQFVYISVKKNKNIDKLLDAILLQAEMLELKTITNCMAKGIVIESYLDKFLGPTIIVLIKKGTLKKNDYIICGLEYGKVKCIKNEKNKNIFFVNSSKPIKILGLSGIPKAGDILKVVKNKKKAKKISLNYKNKFRENKLNKKKNKNFKNFFKNVNNKNYKLNIVLKSDVQGTNEAIIQALRKLSNKKKKIKLISSNVGNINENDVMLALTSNSILIGFNVKANYNVINIIKKKKINIKYYSVIYDLINDIKKILINLSKPKYKEKIIGLAKVKEIFKYSKSKYIAGCIVIKGNIENLNKIRILRNNKIIYKGEIESLKYYKKIVKKVKENKECGIGIKNYNNILIGDMIESFKIF